LRVLLEMELISKELDLKWGPVAHFILFTGILVFYGGALLFKKGGFSEMTPLERMSCLAAIGVSYSLFNSGLLGYRFFPVILDKRVRLSIYVCCAVVVSFSLMIFLACANFNVHQFVTEFSWAFFVPMGAFSGLILGLERAAQKKIGKIRA
jgi:hypothetical protein